ncbi:MAG: hypothetical protein VYB72_13595 [Planctomycetota bacterium]|nr:hypothetical protein [Planctomycetota bacterium]
MYRLQTTFIHLFCGVVLFGQAAVWMHVGACDTGFAATDRAPVEGFLNLEDNCCCHHEHDKAERSQGDDSEPCSDSHDSDSCAICQQLYTPNGVENLTESLAYQRLPATLSEVVSSQTSLSISIEEVRPRGPPSIV